MTFLIASLEACSSALFAFLKALLSLSFFVSV